MAAGSAVDSGSGRSISGLPRANRALAAGSTVRGAVAKSPAADGKSAAAGLKAGQPLAGAPDSSPAAGSGSPAGAGNSRAGGDIRSLLASLKLPGGELSASILSFAKFFSLPLDGPFLGKVRRRALAGREGPSAPPGKASPPASGFQFREALALAALASAAKGLELNPEALAAYARALLYGQVPPEDRDAGDDRGSGESGGEEGSYAAGEEGGSGGKAAPGETGDAFRGKRAPRREIPGACIRERALAQGPLLDILNRLPGKDGKRWIVLPFSLEGLDICLRVLLAGSRAELMALDIRGGEGVWRFTLRPGDPPSGGWKAGPDSPWSLELCRVSGKAPGDAPGEGRAEVFQRELAEFLGIPAGKIRVRCAPAFAESRDWILPSVNEEV